MPGRFHCYIRFVLLLSLSLYLDTKQSGDNQTTSVSKYHSRTMWSCLRILYVLTLQCQPPLGLGLGLVVLYLLLYPPLRQLTRTRRLSCLTTPNSNLFCLGTPGTNKQSWNAFVKHIENEYVDGWHARLFSLLPLTTISPFLRRTPDNVMRRGGLIWPTWRMIALGYIKRRFCCSRSVKS